MEVIDATLAPKDPVCGPGYPLLETRSLSRETRLPMTTVIQQSQPRRAYRALKASPSGWKYRGTRGRAPPFGRALLRSGKTGGEPPTLLLGVVWWLLVAWRRTFILFR